jgi:hypothetical protein
MFQINDKEILPWIRLGGRVHVWSSDINLPNAPYMYNGLLGKYNILTQTKYPYEIHGPFSLDSVDYVVGLGKQLSYIRVLYQKWNAPNITTYFPQFEICKDDRYIYRKEII